MAALIRTDENIRADVLEELKWDPRVQSNEIGVAVKDWDRHADWLGRFVSEKDRC